MVEYVLIKLMHTLFCCRNILKVVIFHDLVVLINLYIGDQLISRTIEQELLMDYEVKSFSYKYVENDFYFKRINKKRRSWQNKIYNKYIKNYGSPYSCE